MHAHTAPHLEHLPERPFAQRPLDLEVVHRKAAPARHERGERCNRGSRAQRPRGALRQAHAVGSRHATFRAGVGPDLTVHGVGYALSVSVKGAMAVRWKKGAFAL
jgi:hypothetical protein